MLPAGAASLPVFCFAAAPLPAHEAVAMPSVRTSPSAIIPRVLSCSTSLFGCVCSRLPVCFGNPPARREFHCRAARVMQRPRSVGHVVPVEGIEPPLLAEHDFESCASTSSATRAQSGNRQGETIAASFVEHDRLGNPATPFPDHAPGSIYIFDPRTRQKKINPRRRRRPLSFRGLHPPSGSANCRAANAVARPRRNRNPG